MDGETDGTVSTEIPFNLSELNFLDLGVVPHTIFILYVLLILFIPVD